ncbi:MAG: hypothetical protein QW680_13270 [Pyrobaculum sp.]
MASFLVAVLAGVIVTVAASFVARHEFFIGGVTAGFLASSMGRAILAGIFTGILGSIIVSLIKLIPILTLLEPSVALRLLMASPGIILFNTIISALGSLFGRLFKGIIKERYDKKKDVEYL